MTFSNQLRAVVADCSTSTSNHYYETRGHAIGRIGDVLNLFGLDCEWYSARDTSHKSAHCGQARIGIVESGQEEPIGEMLFSWSRTPGGRYAITVCLI